MACLECRRRRIKCDNEHPHCRSCTRLGKHCEYTEERKRGPKKRNIGELEQRLATLESQLKASSHASESPFSVPFDASGFDFSMPDAGEMPFAWAPGFFPAVDEEADLNCGNSMNPMALVNGEAIFGAQKLPDVTTMEELTAIYFDYVYPRMPCVHEGLYRRELLLDRREQPPLCLRYIMWAQAAAITERYVDQAKDLYEKSRDAFHHDEIQDKTSTVLTLRHVQTLAMTATHEASMAVSSRAYMSSKRTVALAQVLGLYSMGYGLPAKTYYHSLKQPDDFSEAEEQRRTFWATFIADIWASGSVGFRIQMNARDVVIPLPCSEEAFHSGNPEQMQTLNDVMKNGFLAGTSAYSAVIVATVLMGRQMVHFQGFQNGEALKNIEEFWLRNDEIDSDISLLFMSLPESLRAPVNDPSAFFLVMLLHELVISVHRTAIAVHEQLNPSEVDRISKSRARCERAATEIVDLMRLASSMVDPRRMMPWTSSALYISATALISHVKQENVPNPNKYYHQIAFLITSIKSLTKYALGAQLFLEHLDKDLRRNGLDVLLQISENAVENGRVIADHLRSGMADASPFQGILPPT